MKNLLGFLLGIKNSSFQQESKSIFPILLMVLFINCAPEKTEVTDLDMHRLIDRVSFTRFSERLDMEDSTKIKSDREIFLETCEIYRLNPNTVLEKLKTSHPKLYNRFKEKNEN